jgi:hypothetical protein
MASNRVENDATKSLIFGDARSNCFRKENVGLDAVATLARFVKVAMSAPAKYRIKPTLSGTSHYVYP